MTVPPQSETARITGERSAELLVKAENLEQMQDAEETETASVFDGLEAERGTLKVSVNQWTEKYERERREYYALQRDLEAKMSGKVAHTWIAENGVEVWAIN